MAITLSRHKITTAHPDVRPRTIRTSFTLPVMAVATATSLSFYEYITDYAFPRLPVWETRIVVIAILTLLVIRVMRMPLRRYEALVESDTTERKQGEDALPASEERYRLLFESNPQPMWVYAIETLQFQAVNDAAVEHYGYSREEFLGMSILDIRPAEEVEKLLNNVSGGVEAFQDTGPWKHCKKDGTVILVEITSHTLLFSGCPARLVMATDITERLRAEGALRENEERLQLALEAGGVSIWNRDLITGECTGARDYERILGLAPGSRKRLRIFPRLRASRGPRSSHSGACIGSTGA